MNDSLLILSSDWPRQLSVSWRAWLVRSYRSDSELVCFSAAKRRKKKFKYLQFVLFFRLEKRPKKKKRRRRKRKKKFVEKKT